MKLRRLALPLSLLLAVPAALVAPAQAAEVRTLNVTTVQDGLSIPWDLAFLPSVSGLPDGGILYTERSSKKLSLKLPGQSPRTIFTSPENMWASGETGLMAVELAPDFATSRAFVTCHGYKSGDVQDVRVVRWVFDETFTSATRQRDLVTGLPSSSGRHGGCSLVKGSGDELYVGTGDAAQGRNPQDLKSGGGKVLRVDITTGDAISTNPYATSIYANKRKVFTYGHRNVQGLARRADGRIWSAEHGSNRDDEVNLLTNGGNYGWNPVPRRSGDPSYNEGSNSPMTDTSLPGAQQAAKWRSGRPTIAPSGIAWLSGSQWGSLDGTLAMSVLGDQQLRILRFSAAGTLQGTYVPPELKGTYGRLRAAVMGPDGSLYVTTSNGSNDKILKVTPSFSQN